MAKLADGSYNNDERFQKYQQLFLETGDIKHLWEVYPEIVHAIKSCMVKVLKGKRINFFNEKAESAAIYFIDLMKRKPRKIDRLMGYASFLAMKALYSRNKDENWEDWESIPEDDWVEDKND